MAIDTLGTRYLKAMKQEAYTGLGKRFAGFLLTRQLGPHCIQAQTRTLWSGKVAVHWFLECRRMSYDKIALKIEPHLREQKAKPKAPPDAPKGRVGTNWPWGD